MNGPRGEIVFSTGQELTFKANMDKKSSPELSPHRLMDTQMDVFVNLMLKC